MTMGITKRLGQEDPTTLSFRSGSKGCGSSKANRQIVATT
jgi:hypothetical protein